MDMMDWAENEVKIACERERKASNITEGEWDYSCACYQSALKAYKSLIDDGHSGFSWDITANILKRLLHGNPLTPIEDVNDTWSDEPIYKSDDHVTYQCKRKLSLSKDVYNDGRVKYCDSCMFICVDIHSGVTYTSGIVIKVMQEIFPITFPYMPGNCIEVYCEDFLTDPKNGDYDTKGVLYAIDPEGERLEINKFFGEVNGKMVEITKEEYEKRRSLSEEWKRKENKNVSKNTQKNS